MAGVCDIAAYILRARGPMTAMKLQKLCNYAYGCYLAWESRRLFEEPSAASRRAAHSGTRSPGHPADADQAGR